MKITFVVLVALLLSFSSAQNQNYTFTEGSFTYLVRIYDDVAVGDLAFGFNTHTSDTGIEGAPLSITEYIYTGIDANGTLYLLSSTLHD